MNCRQGNPSILVSFQSVVRIVNNLILGFRGKMVEGDEKYASFLVKKRNQVLCSIAVTKAHPDDAAH